MLAWLQQNWGSILVVAVVAVIFASVIVCRIRAKKQGKSTCGCGCEQCAMQGMCHSNEKPKDPEN